MSPDTFKTSFWQKEETKSELNELEESLKEQGLFEKLEDYFQLSQKAKVISKSENTLVEKPDVLKFIDSKRAQNISKSYLFKLF